MPELEITESEALRLTTASVALIREYGLSLSPRTAAWLAFVAAAGIVYVPRGIAIQGRIQRQRAERKARTEAPPDAGPAN